MLGGRSKGGLNKEVFQFKYISQDEAYDFMRELLGDDRDRVRQRFVAGRDSFERSVLEWRLLKHRKMAVHFKRLQIACLACFVGIWASLAVLQTIKSDSPSIASYVSQISFANGLIATIMCVCSLYLCIAMYVDSQKTSEVRERIGRLKEGERRSKATDVEQVPARRKGMTPDKETMIASYADLGGTAMTTGMQLIGFLGGLGIILDVNNYPKDSAMNTQGIVDTIGNALCFFAAVGFWKVCRDRSANAAENKAELGQESLMSGLMAIGAGFILLGKILFSFESKCGGIYSGESGIMGWERIPVGLAVRIVGAAFCFVALSGGLALKKGAVMMAEAELASGKVELLRRGVEVVRSSNALPGSGRSA